MWWCAPADPPPKRIPTPASHGLIGVAVAMPQRSCEYVSTGIKKRREDTTDEQNFS